MRTIFVVLFFASSAVAADARTLDILRTGFSTNTWLGCAVKAK